MGKVFDLNGEDLTKTDATLRVPEAPADAAEVGKRNDAQTESLKAEKSRAEGAEQKLQQQVDTLNAGGLNLKEDLIRTQVDSYLTQHPEAMGTAVAEETTRAKAAEEENAKGVSQLKEDLTELRNDVLDEPSNPNLIDWNKCEKGKIFLGNGLYQDNDIGWISNIIEVEPNTTYVFSSISTNQELYFAGVYEFDVNKNYISLTGNTTKITTQANTKYIQIQVRYMTASGQGAESGETKDDLSQDYLWNKTKLQKGDTPTVIADTKLNSSVKVTNNNLDTDVSGDIAKGVYAYDNMTETTSWYKNKIMMSYGDSIVAMGGWQPYVQEYFGIANGYNRGIGGTTVSNNGQKATLWDGTQIDGWMCGDDRIAQMEPTNNDFLLILAGHNDWGFNVPIGEIGETLVDSNFKSAYALMLKKVFAKFPNIPIICMTPINGRLHTGGVAQETPEKNTLGLTMADYAIAVKDVCQQYGVPCIDLNAESRINVLNGDKYLQDVIHPNDDGWKLVANAVINGMKRFEPIVLTN